MNIITFGNTSFSVLINDLKYPFDNEGKHMLCQNISVWHSNPNTRDVLLKKEGNRGTQFMDMDDVQEELDKFADEKIIWRSKERKKSLMDYYNGVMRIMRAYKREEQINKVLMSNEYSLSLAC